MYLCYIFILHIYSNRECYYVYKQVYVMMNEKRKILLNTIFTI